MTQYLSSKQASKQASKFSLTLTLAAASVFSFSSPAQATLTSYTGAGNTGLVYSSVSDVTWTQDANLFKTLYTSNANLINQIAAVTPTYTDSYWGVQTIDAGDFNTSNGRMTWWGAKAWVNYLNSITYGGSNQWRLPSAGSNPQSGWNQTGSELGQLFYSELHGTAGSNIPNTSTFNNEQTYAYWSGTEKPPFPNIAWGFYTTTGFQGDYYKSDQYSAWAVSPGQVAAVPVPGAVWLFGTGLVGLAGLKRRGHVG